MDRKDQKIGYFERLISQERKELSKIWFDFQNPRSFPHKKRYNQIFRISTPSPSKLSPNVGTEKSPNSGFSILSSLVARITFILHSQIEDNEGLLQWRFHVDCIFASRIMGNFRKRAQNGPKWSKMIQNQWNLNILRKSDHSISSMFWIQLGDNIWLILPKTTCLVKNRV